MAELADAEDLKSSGLCARAGSSPAPGKNFISAQKLMGWSDFWQFSHKFGLEPVIKRGQCPFKSRSRQNFISARILKVRVNVYNFRANLGLNPQ